MKTLILLFMISSLSVFAQDPDSSTALFSVAEAERNFSRASVAIGRVNAFKENLADESVVFQPDPIDGQKFYSQRKPSPLLLTWEPEYVDVAASEDFGISHGPWEMKDYGPKKIPPFWGYYVSVWKKQADGKWKVVVDMGNGVETKPAYEVKLSYPKGSDKKREFKAVDAKTVESSLMKWEDEFAKLSKNNVEMYMKHLTTDARIIRMGHFPATSTDSIRALLGKQTDLTWKPIDGDVATSGDLGYSYGSYESKSEKGHYLHIWKKQADQSWKMVIDVQLPKE